MQPDEPPDEMAREEGRALFGGPAYADARPDYPERVYTLLVERCGLAPGCATLEIGPGSGQATRRLIELGARPLVLVEPDPRFADPLARLARASGGAVAPIANDFESASLGAGAFDLAVCATSFHWLDRTTGPRRLGERLRAGGWLALFWNVFGDPGEPDPFHDATQSLLAHLAVSPSHEKPGLPFALDVDARRDDFRNAGALDDFDVEEIRWTLRLRPAGVRALYATFSPIARLAPAERALLLDRLEAVAEGTFAGEVERRMVTPVYVGRRQRRPRA